MAVPLIDVEVVLEAAPPPPPQAVKIVIKPRQMSLMRTINYLIKKNTKSILHHRFELNSRNVGLIHALGWLSLEKLNLRR